MRLRGPFLESILLLVLSGSLLIAAASPAAGGTPHPMATAPAGILVVTFDIQVDAGAADYVQRAVAVAVANGQDLVLVMDTPGGLLANMQQIVSSIGNDAQANGRRVYTFVPPNDFAASAGSYIALATDAIYMGSGSIIGPSTPFVVGGSPAEQAHVEGAMLAYIVSLAERNGYNVSAAADMVENNRAYSADQAASVGLITGRAESLDDALAALGLRSLPRTTFDEPLYDRFLSFLSDPTVDGLFILVGVIALVLDLLHRTLFLTIVAVVMIALGLLGAQIIGAPLVAILVLLIAAALVFLELKAGHGLFAGTGIVLGLGGTYLLAYGVGYSPSPFGVGQYVLMGVVAAVVAVGFVYLTKIRRSLMAQPKLVDPTRVIDKTGRAITDILPGKDGVANVDAEDWTAVSPVPIEKGSLVKVKSYLDGKVHVEKLSSSGTSADQATKPA